MPPFEVTQALLMRQSARLKIYIGIGAAALLLLIFALAGGLYLAGNSPTQTRPQKLIPNPVPFDYRVDVSPTSSTVMQGNNVQINVSITYLKGSAENITLSALGVPQGADYTFSLPKGALGNSSALNRILTIYVSEATQTNTYNVTIESTADNGKTHCSLYSLSVLNSKVLVSGTVSVGSGVPIQILFDQLTHAGATVQTFTAAIQSGNYVISLPNQQFYAVSIVWENSDGASGTHQFIMPYNTDAGVGITQINCPFSLGT